MLILFFVCVCLCAIMTNVIIIIIKKVIMWQKKKERYIREILERIGILTQLQYNDNK